MDLCTKTSSPPFVHPAFHCAIPRLLVTSILPNWNFQRGSWLCSRMWLCWVLLVLWFASTGEPTCRYAMISTDCLLDEVSEFFMVTRRIEDHRCFPATLCEFWRLFLCCSLDPLCGTVSLTIIMKNAP